MTDLTPVVNKPNIGDRRTLRFTLANVNGDPITLTKAKCIVTQKKPLISSSTDVTASTVQDGDALTLTVDLDTSGTWEWKLVYDDTGDTGFVETEDFRLDVESDTVSTEEPVARATQQVVGSRSSRRLGLFKKTYIPDPYSGTDSVLIALDIPESEVDWTTAQATASRVVATDENSSGLIVSTTLEVDVAEDGTETINLRLLGTEGAGLYKISFDLESAASDKYRHYVLVWIVPPLLTSAEAGALVGDEGQVLLGDEGQTLTLS